MTTKTAHSRPASYYVTDADGGRYVEPITLRINVYSDHGHTGHGYFAHFDNQDQALEFLNSLKAADEALRPADKPWWFAPETYHTYSETSEYPIPLSADRLLDLLYPTCEHGLSADLCEGPGHYAPDHPVYR